MTTIQTREAMGANDDPVEEIVYDGEERVADEDKASLEEDDADGKSEGSTPTYSNQVMLDSPFTPE
jgi:hypothetical protein